MEVRSLGAPAGWMPFFYRGPWAPQMPAGWCARGRGAADLPDKMFTNSMSPAAASDEYAWNAFRKTGSYVKGWTQRSTSSAGAPSCLADKMRARWDEDISPFFQIPETQTTGEDPGIWSDYPRRAKPQFPRNRGKDKETNTKYNRDGPTGRTKRTPKK